MADQKDTPNLFNPFLLWADWGMRAAEATIASAQNLTDGADRVARAVAGAEANEVADVSTASDADTSAATAFDGIANMQRWAWDMAAQNWTRWMSSIGGILSAGAGVELASKLTGKDNALQAVRDSLRPASWGEKPATGGRNAGALVYPKQRRSERVSEGSAQHAFASDEAKPRRKAAAKTKRAKRVSRK
ncbi:hypothetical protein [Ramlibacter sp. WS9]|uniref:hypothetical protein n=1 Tax=Ramlibacter sp. WS9 TaxID=1882741 RepID=UPI001143D927|nr:hypothetical protein [Ramlibacter sp. WS9]